MQGTSVISLVNRMSLPAEGLRVKRQVVREAE